MCSCGGKVITHLCVANIYHVSGKGNVVADALSHVEAVQSRIHLGASQENNLLIKRLLFRDSGLKLKSAYCCYDVKLNSTSLIVFLC